MSLEDLEYLILFASILVFISTGILVLIIIRIHNKLKKDK